MAACCDQMEGLVHFLESPEFTFHGELDDTLMNRLNSCIMCCDEFHVTVDRYQKDYPSTQFLLQCLDRFRVPSDTVLVAHELNRLRIILCLLIKRLCLKSDTNLCTSLTQFFNVSCSMPDNAFTFAIVDAIVLYLRSACTISSLQLLESLIDRNTRTIFIDHLNNPTNIHYHKHFLNLFAHLAILEQDNPPVDDITSQLLALNEAVAVDFLWHVYITSIAMKIPIKTIDFQYNSKCTAKLLFLMCHDVVRVPGLEDSGFLEHLKDTLNLSRLASEVISLHLRSTNSSNSYSLFNNLLSYWTNQVAASLCFPKQSQLLPLIRPIEQLCLQKHSGDCKCLLNTPADFFLLIWNEICGTNDGTEMIFTISHCKYRSHLLKLMTVLCQHSRIKSVVEVCEHIQAVQYRLGTLLSQSECSIVFEELSWLLQYASSLLTVLLEVDRSTSVVGQFVKALINWCTNVATNTNVIFLLIERLIHVTERILHLWQQPDVSLDCEVIVVVLQGLLSSATLLLSSSARIQFSCDDRDGFQKIQFLILSVLKILVPQLNTTVFTSIRSNLSELLVTVFAADNPTDDLLVNAEIRGFLICIFIWGVSFATEYVRERYIGTCDIAFDCWVENTLKNELMNFEWSELFESNTVICEVQRVCQLSLHEELPLSSDLCHFLTDLLTRLVASFALHKICTVSQCPSCGESLQDLIENILIAHAGPLMSADCSEG